MERKKIKRQLLIGFIMFGIFLISGSIQVIHYPYLFVRVVSLFVVIGSSLVLGAFIRELFILKKGKNPNQLI